MNYAGCYLLRYLDVSYSLIHRNFQLTKHGTPYFPTAHIFEPLLVKQPLLAEAYNEWNRI